MTKTISDIPAGHSFLGASSAERWMACPGSVALIKAIALTADPEAEEPDYRRDGVQAHALAAMCLEADVDAWELDDTAAFPDVTPEMMEAVQSYLDYVRSLPGIRHVESRVHRPELHSDFYGTLDFAAVSRKTGGGIHFVDYKHGVGVVVEVEYNLQLMYYAYGFLGDDEDYENSEPVELTVVQPRADHCDGPIRTWATTVGEIRQWAHEVLLPAMQATETDAYLDMGDHCRFCPAKLVCPAMRALAHKGLTGAEQVTYAEAQQLKMLLKAVEERAYARLMAGELPEVVGAKLVRGRANRLWKVMAPLGAVFGKEAWNEPTLRSPAQIEKLPEGKTFTAEWAFSPEAGLVLATLDNKKAAVKPKATDEKFSAGLSRLEE